MRCSTEVEFFPVILSDDPRPVADGIDPAAVRIAYAAHLSDGDMVVGYAQLLTYSSLKSVCTDSTATGVLGGEFFYRAYPVVSHEIDPNGWVSLGQNCFVWRSNDLALYVPARSV
ncbi:hypothetical protein ABT033_31350 [Streptomyces pharetrae]|uniref:hypothetical protein n=1 Tax=Streptomyces pharetrae TaxID=291370 RepID=UPI0033559EB4